MQETYSLADELLASQTVAEYPHCKLKIAGVVGIQHEEMPKMRHHYREERRM